MRSASGQWSDRASTASAWPAVGALLWPNAPRATLSAAASARPCREGDVVQADGIAAAQRLGRGDLRHLVAGDALRAGLAAQCLHGLAARALRGHQAQRGRRRHAVIDLAPQAAAAQAWPVRIAGLAFAAHRQRRRLGRFVAQVAVEVAQQHQRIGPVARGLLLHPGFERRQLGAQHLAVGFVAVQLATAIGPRILQRRDADDSGARSAHAAACRRLPASAPGPAAAGPWPAARAATAANRPRSCASGPGSASRRWPVAAPCGLRRSRPPSPGHRPAALAHRGRAADLLEGDDLRIHPLRPAARRSAAGGGHRRPR